MGPGPRVGGGRLVERAALSQQGAQVRLEILPCG